MTRVLVVALMALALSLPVGAPARAQTHQTTDRPDAGPPLLDPNMPRQPTADTERKPGVPPPRSLDSKRAPVPDRLALPEDMQDIPLAPPTPPVPPMEGNKNGEKTSSQTGGGPNRVKQIFKSPGGGQDVPRGSATRTPEDQVPMPAAGR